jgi:Domain of unknown function (DUF4381)
MNPGWLTQLAPEHVPPMPGWWPPAPGWWGVALLSVLLAAGLIWRWHDPHRKYRRAALRELRRIGADTSDPVTTARAIENLLRRFAIAIFGGERVAGLTGATWLRFVAHESREWLEGETGRSLLNTAFGGRESRQQASGQHREQWLTAADAFIRRAARKPRPASPSDSAPDPGSKPQPATTARGRFAFARGPLDRGPSARRLK